MPSPKNRRETGSLHLSPEEAELLAVETARGRKRPGTAEDRYPHERPSGELSEEAVVQALMGNEGDDGQEAREDADETIIDAQDRAGTEEDPDPAAP